MKINQYMLGDYRKTLPKKIWTIFSACCNVLLYSLLIIIGYMAFFSKTAQVILVTGVSAEPVIPNYSLIAINQYDKDDYHIGDFLTTQRGLTITHVCYKIDKSDDDYVFYTAALDFLVKEDKGSGPLTKKNTFRYVGDGSGDIMAYIDMDGRWGEYRIPVRVLFGYDNTGDTWEENQQILKDGKAKEIIILNSSTNGTTIDRVLGESRYHYEVRGKVIAKFTIIGNIINYVKFQGGATETVLLIFAMILMFSVFKAKYMYDPLLLDNATQRDVL